jgi:tyrosine-protein kinase Etk/Wzc
MEATARYGDSVALREVRFAVAEHPGSFEEATLILRSEPAAIEDYHKVLQASIRDQTDAIDIAYQAPDPAFAQRVVNATVEIFRDLNATQAQQKAHRRRVFVEEQLAQTDSALARAQTALAQFQQEKGVFSSQEWAASQQQALMDLDMRREELIADRTTLRSLQAGLEGGQEFAQLRTLMSIPSLGSNQMVSALFQQLVRYETVLDSLTTGEWRSASSNPDVQRFRSLVTGSREQLAGLVSGHLADLNARIAALDDLRARNEAQMRTLPAQGAQEVRLVQQVEGIRNVADQLREEYQRSRIEEAVEAGQVEVVDTAALPVKPIGSGNALKLGLALVLGLMLGSGAAFVKENLNSSIHRKDELEGLLRVPSLAVIPRIAGSAAIRRGLQLPGPLFGRQNGHGNGADPAGGLHELVTVSQARSSGSEAYRTLRTNLIFSQAVQSLETLVVTSSSPSEGKTTTTANLAVTFAQQGMRVLVVDCDLRKARLHQVFGVPREPGLTQLMLGHRTVEDIAHATAVEGLFMLSAGTLPPNPSELLGGTLMKETLAMFGERFDLVILDTPPLLAASDAAVLGRSVDGVLLVVRAGHTDRSAAQLAVEQLRTVGARVVGAVLNDPDAKIPSYGGYYHYDYYGTDASARV